MRKVSMLLLAGWMSMGCGAPDDGELATLEGQIVLPRVHPRNLFHQRLLSMMPDHDGITHHHMTYAPMDASEIDLGSVMRVVAVPIPPPPGTPPEIRRREDGDGDFQADFRVYEGTVSPTGQIRIQVPRYRFGYMIAAYGDKVRLSRRVPFAIEPGARHDGLIVDIKHTLLARTAVEKGEDARALSDDDLESKLGGRLPDRVRAMEARLASRLGVADWIREGRDLAVEPGTASSPLTAAEIEASPMNILNADEIAAVSGVTTIPFDRYTKRTPITTNYRTSHVGQLLASSTGAGNGAFEVAGHLEVKVPSGGYLDIYPAGKSYAMGMNVINGILGSTAATSGRRGFTMTAYSTSGIIRELRWYTNQDESSMGYYGITSPSEPIRYLRIQMSGTGSFSIDNLSVAPSAVPLGDLGWRAAGTWTKMSSTRPGGAPVFDHMDRDPTAAYSGGSPTVCTFDYNYSFGTYWMASYGTHPTGGSTLTSPAFTLSDMPLDTDDVADYSALVADSGDGTNYWQVGKNDDLTTTDILSPARCDGGFDRVSLSGTRIGGSGLWPGSRGSATMAYHWGHVHWQSHLDVERDSVTSNGTTERYVEYSTDNGATWNQAYWFHDASHRGRRGVWWKNHMHPFSDSDLAAKESGAACVNTDFNKDGVAEYNYDNDGDGLGAADGDADDCRQWNTEFYQEFPAEPCTAYDATDGCTSAVLGTSMLYRFRFDSGATPDATQCPATETYGKAKVTGLSCAGWAVDDVALSGDDETVGYYTDFDSASDPDLN
jgi:hypothetical protein